MQEKKPVSSEEMIQSIFGQFLQLFIPPKEFKVELVLHFHSSELMSSMMKWNCDELPDVMKSIHHDPSEIKKVEEWVELGFLVAMKLLEKFKGSSSKFNVDMMIHFSINPSEKQNKIFRVVISPTVQS